jgi:hypothetical protein
MSARLLILGCKTMREGVVVSATFLIGAVALFLAARFAVPPDVFYLQQIVLFFALVLIVLAPIVLISTFLLSVIPGAAEKLEKCEH